MYAIYSYEMLVSVPEIPPKVSAFMESDQGEWMGWTPISAMVLLLWPHEIDF